jgi:DNA-binding CsgD family transcriptional regulator
VKPLSIDELTLGLYEAALDTSLIPVALENISRRLGCHTYHQLLIDIPSNQVMGGWTGDVVAESVQRQYEEHYMYQDTRPILADQIGIGRYFSTDAFVSEKDISKSELFQKFLLPNGVKHTLGSNTFNDGQSKLTVAFLAANDRDNFSNDEHKTLSLLMPHLRKSAALMFKSQALQLAADKGSIGFDALSCAAITLSSKHRIMSLNHLAQDLLIEGRFIQNIAGSFQATGQNNLGFAALLKRVQTTGIAESLALYAPGSNNVTYATVTKLSAHFGNQKIDSATLLILIDQPKNKQIASVNQLMQVFKFSPAEARLAHELALGKDLETYANERRIQLSTVRSQIAAIHLKAGVQKQTDLLRAIYAVPCVPRRYKLD